MPLSLPRRFTTASLALILLTLPAALVATGCAATATFHSRTGAVYTPLAVRAIDCSEDEARRVTAAGGVAIGTIDAKALRVNASAGDLADKAAKVAADRGGTHMVLTSRGIESFTMVQPGQVDTVCQHTADGKECASTYTPPTETTVEKPTAEYVVLRVPPAGWARLPESLRPAPRAP